MRAPISPHERTLGMAWFPRMLDKIRLNASDELPEDYKSNLGKGFDGRCVRFLRVAYEEVVKRTLEGGTNEEILDWCMANGRELNEEDIGVWSDFMRKRGLRDSDKVRASLEQSKARAGLQGRTDIDTFFKCQDADEGREPRD